MSIKVLASKLHEWRRYRVSLRELARLSDRELCVIGLRRADIVPSPRLDTRPVRRRRRRARMLAMTTIAGRARNAYESGSGAARSVADTTRRTIAGTVVPAVSGAVGSTLATVAA